MSANHIRNRDFIRFSSSSNALSQPFQDWLLLVGDVIPSPMFVSIFVQYAFKNHWTSREALG